MITIRHLRKEYENATPLRDLNVTINKGDVISVIGPSGTGKSTLLRCINMLERPTSGEIIINGKNILDKDCNINQIRRKLGMVFQSFNLFGHLTVIENVMKAPVELLGLSRQEAYDRGIELLRMVGMEGRIFNYPDMLSGGQKQRVAIARTLAMDPDIILFDEPTSALDPTMVGEVESVITSLAESGKTMMLVTHDMRFARSICNRVFYMDDGGVYEDGTPEQIFDNPQKERTRRFIRHLKTFEAKIESRDFDFIGAVSSLDGYGYKNQLPSKTVYHLQQLFEELCEQILLPHFETPNIRFTVEYDEKNERAAAIVDYSGEPFDIRTSDNAISLSIIEALADNIEWTADEVNEGYTNKLTVSVK